MKPKKNPKYDLNSQRHLFFSIGMVISLAVVLVAFEWKSPIDPVVGDLDSYVISCEFDFSTEEELPYEPPSTSWNDDGSVSINQAWWVCNTSLEDYTNYTQCGTDQPTVDEQSYIFISETMPSFESGSDGLKEFVETHLEYPKQAKRMGIEGRVFVQFIVEKDGALSEFEVLKGVGAGLDEETIRVMKLIPDFIPGKQQGVPVRVKMVYPVNFTLHQSR